MLALRYVPGLKGCARGVDGRGRVLAQDAGRRPPAAAHKALPRHSAGGETLGQVTSTKFPSAGFF